MPIFPVTVSFYTRIKRNLHLQVEAKHLDEAEAKATLLTKNEYPDEYIEIDQIIVGGIRKNAE